MISVPVLPDCAHIRRTDAYDLATAIVQAIRCTGRAVRVYLGADGAVGYEWIGKHPVEPLLADCMSMVGHYTDEATVGQITEDLMAMERERIA